MVLSKVVQLRYRIVVKPILQTPHDISHVGLLQFRSQRRGIVRFADLGLPPCNQPEKEVRKFLDVRLDLSFYAQFVTANGVAERQTNTSSIVAVDYLSVW